MKHRRILWNKVIVLLIGLVMACMLTCAIGSALAPKARGFVLSLFSKNDPELASQVAHEMIDYDLPSGYAEQGVIQVKGYYNLVLIPSTSDPSDVIAIQPASSDFQQNPEWSDTLEERAAQELGDLHYRTHTVRLQDAIIRDQQITLRILEGEDEEGNPVRQVLSTQSR